MRSLPPWLMERGEGVVPERKTSWSSSKLPGMPLRVRAF